MRRPSIVVLVVLGAIAAVFIAALPPRAAEPSGAVRSRWPVVKGAYHIHSERSDGTGTVDEIAEAAARAGLQFVIITDHGDGTRAPDPPTFRSGVLCIDAVEVSTAGGHVAALAMPQMPYRLAGLPRDVIDDVHRFGGMTIVAHPGSPKVALQWRDWDAPFDGVEWLNGDSEWRDEFWGSLGRVLLTYPVRPAETLATLLDRPEAVMAQWDRAARGRHVVGIAGADAHARLGLRSATEPYDDRVIAKLPSYEASFRAFANHVILDAPFSGDAARDAHELLDAIRWGRIVTSVEGLARLGGIEVTATGDGFVHVVRPGEYIDSGAGVRFDVSVAGPESMRLVLFRDGTPIDGVVANHFAAAVGAEPAAYRVEAYLPESFRSPSVPWLVTNPVYVNLTAAHKPKRESTEVSTTNRTHIPTAEWQAESSPGSRSELSQATLEDGAPALMWQLHVDGGASASPFAAVSFPLEAPIATHRGIQLRARADRPMRILAQLRTPGARGGRRWSRSFYLDRHMRLVYLPFDEFRPVVPAVASDAEPPLTEIESLLFVADTLNTLPGTSAAIAFSDLWLVK